MNPKPQTIQACGHCWIEVQLLDEDGVGVPREPYWVRLPNGEVREGRLDDNGLVRFDPIPCGICLVRFPRNKSPIEQEAARAKGDHWIEVRLLDLDDVPLAGEQYAITLPDNSKRNGKLDARGIARLDGIPEGTCIVEFPGIDRADFATSTSADNGRN